MRYWFFLLCFVFFIVGIDVAHGSTAFERKVFHDEAYDSETLDTKENLEQLDFTTMVFRSDGTYLNSTIWFENPLSINEDLYESIQLVLIINTSLDFDSGFEGIDFMSGYIFEDNKWEKVLVEFPNKKNTHVIYQIDEANSPIVNGTYEEAISMSLNLEHLGNPEKYLVAFYSFNGTSHSVDISNWIEIPSPAFDVTVSPDTITLEPGEKGSVEVLVESHSNVSRNAELSIESKGLVIEPKISNQLNFSPQGRDSIILDIKSPDEDYSSHYTVSLEVVSVPPEGLTGVKNQNLDTEGFTNDFLPSNNTPMKQ